MVHSPITFPSSLVLVNKETVKGVTRKKAKKVRSTRTTTTKKKKRKETNLKIYAIKNIKFGGCIPANFFSVKCVRFFVSTESEFPKIYRRLPKIAEDFGRLPRIDESFQRLPKITEDRASNDFQRISNQSRALLESRRCSDNFSNVKKQLNFYLIGFWAITLAIVS